MAAVRMNVSRLAARLAPLPPMTITPLPRGRGRRSEKRREGGERRRAWRKDSAGRRSEPACEFHRHFVCAQPDRRGTLTRYRERRPGLPMVQPRSRRC